MQVNEKSEKECKALLEKIFLPPEMLLEKFAPNGWELSSLFTTKYPTPQERYERSLQMHHNFESLAQKAGRPMPKPNLEDFENEPLQVSGAPLEDLLDLLGDGVWSVFSENNNVIAPNGALYHLGSWRGSGRFIADFFNEHYPVNGKYRYIDFYMGLLYEEDRAKCGVIFRHIFEVLKEEGCDWRFDQERRDDLEDARYEPPPAVVQVYWEVYGRWPEGSAVENG